MVRHSRIPTILAAAGLMVHWASGSACADVFSLNPVADTFVSSAQPDGNFGGAGGLTVAAPGQPQGEFQSLLRFDTVPAITSFNTTYGVGNWVITGMTLQFTTTAPNNPIFNPAAAGPFTLSWMQNDSWVEGTGGPSSPSATGVNFNTLPSFLSPSDEFLGNFNYPGGTSGTVVCSPIITGGLAGDVGFGNLVSFRLSAATTTIAWVFNSRSFGTVASRPVFSISVVGSPAPGAAGVFGLASLTALRRRRR